MIAHLFNGIFYAVVIATAAALIVPPLANLISMKIK
jgi:hypothetical protein